VYLVFWSYLFIGLRDGTDERWWIDLSHLSILFSSYTVLYDLRDHILLLKSLSRTEIYVSAMIRRNSTRPPDEVLITRDQDVSCRGSLPSEVAFCKSGHMDNYRLSNHSKNAIARALHLGFWRPIWCLDSEGLKGPSRARVDPLFIGLRRQHLETIEGSWTAEKRNLTYWGLKSAGQTW